jgi:molecular chaperone DnaK
MVGELTGKQVSVGDPEPDLCVALGAAYYATILEVQQASDPNSTMTNQQKDEVRKKVASLPPAQAKAFTGTKVTMVTSHAYGVEVLDENHQTCNEVMIKKNSPLPASHSATFGLVHDNQTSVEINVWEGEESNLQFCTKAGTGEMSGFPPSPQGTPVEIQMEFTPEGVIKVRAECRGKTFEGTFERPQGMSAAEQEAAGRMMARMKVE